MKKRRRRELAFEDSLSDDWSRDTKIAEVPIGGRPFLALGIIIVIIALGIGGQIVYLNISWGSYYAARAADNVGDENQTPAPRGKILDREGDVLAEDKAAFAAVLNTRVFVGADPNIQSSTINAVEQILGITPVAFSELIAEAGGSDFASPVVLADDISDSELVHLQALALPTIELKNDFRREYPDGATFASVVGYTGRPSSDDLKFHPALTATDFVGKTGVEAYYDDALRGVPGVNIEYKNAHGILLGAGNQSAPKIGSTVVLTIDGGLQHYFYTRFANGLASLGRPIGLGVAIDPRNGEILSLINLPGYDNNLFSRSGSSTVVALRALFNSPNQPFFDRAISGNYNPGSTIKPLDGVAALKDGVVDPGRQIFSPGYILVPNPYNSSTPTKYLDWRYQGRVNLTSALAQSSDVYFYLVGGGSPVSTSMLNDASDYGINGLGITRLNQWWQAFGLGKKTDIDLPNEASGFLPTPEWKEKKFGTPWLLGDTYNVSIGQGDLLVTPLQLISYIGAIANGGTVWRPHVNMSSTPVVNEDLTSLFTEIQSVQEGMREGVTSPQGTSYTLHNLPFSVCAKTGSAQVHDNSQENALFVGYAPCDAPRVAILILIENSRQGSLNAVPIAKDVLNWYYENRIQ